MTINNYEIDMLNVEDADAFLIHFLTKTIRNMLYSLMVEDILMAKWCLTSSKIHTIRIMLIWQYVPTAMMITMVVYYG